MVRVYSQRVMRTGTSRTQHTDQMVLLGKDKSDAAFRLQQFLDSSFTKKLILLNRLTPTTAPEHQKHTMLFRSGTLRE